MKFNFYLAWHSMVSSFPNGVWVVCMNKGRLLHLCIPPKMKTKVSFFGQCSKMQSIPLKKFNIQICFFEFLWFFKSKCWSKGQIISRIHLSLPNAYKQMCFDRNINGNRDVKFSIGIIGHCTDQRNLLYES